MYILASTLFQSPPHPAGASSLQGFLDHKKTPIPLGPPQNPGHVPKTKSTDLTFSQKLMFFASRLGVLQLYAAVCPGKPET